MNEIPRFIVKMSFHGWLSAWLCYSLLCMGHRCFYKDMRISGYGHGGLLTERPAAHQSVAPESLYNEVLHPSLSFRSRVAVIRRPWRRGVGGVVSGSRRRRCRRAAVGRRSLAGAQRRVGRVPSSLGWAAAGRAWWRSRR